MDEAWPVDVCMRSDCIFDASVKLNKSELIKDKEAEIL